jgi:hypothetical protein
MVALNDKQVALIYSLVLLALVQKTGSTADRPGEPRYRDVRDRWLACTAEELEESGRGWRRCGAPGWGVSLTDPSLGPEWPSRTSAVGYAACRRHLGDPPALAHALQNDEIDDLDHQPLGWLRIASRAR